MSVVRGDKITVAHVRGDHVVWGTVTNVVPLFDKFLWQDRTQELGSIVRLHWGSVETIAIVGDEGVDWIRGHFALGSPEILALEAAHALASR